MKTIQKTGKLIYTQGFYIQLYPVKSAFWLKHYLQVGLEILITESTDSLTLINIDLFLVCFPLY